MHGDPGYDYDLSVIGVASQTTNPDVALYA